MVLYFYLFNKTIKMLTPEELDRFIKEAGSKFDMLVIIALLGCLAYFDGFKANMLFSALITSLIIIGTIRHHKKLRALKYDEAFEKKLLNISYLSTAGVILILSSLTINAYAT